MVDLFGNEDESDNPMTEVVEKTLVDRGLHPISSQPAVRLHPDAEMSLRPVRGPTCATCDFINRNGRSCEYPIAPAGPVAATWPACERWLLSFRLSSATRRV